MLTSFHHSPHLQPGLIICYAETYAQLDLRADRLMSSLTKDDEIQADKFKTPELRRKARVTKGTLRLILSHYLHCSPNQVIIMRDNYGKPFIEGLPVHFNLSHTENALFIAISTDVVGVDAEQGFTDLYLSDVEHFVYSHHPAGKTKNDRELLLRTWTEKEALVKALGKGLSFNFELADWKSVTTTSYQVTTEAKTLFTHYLSTHFGNHLTICTSIPQERIDIQLCRILTLE